MFFINSRNKMINDKLFDKVNFDYIRQVLTFCYEFSTIKLIPEAYLETSGIKFFYNFLKKAPP